jgi:DNA invertase Pin-like site-specific DNA recombinase
MTKRVAIYARVSTADDQTTENQIRELRDVAGQHDWEVVSVFDDNGISGAVPREDRPAMKALLRAVARRKIDMVATWAVDRLGRSLVDLLGFLSELHAKGIGLYLHQQGLDTTTPAGRAMFQMLGVFAEFERAMVRERVLSGMARARASGTRSGKPIGRPAVPEEVNERIRTLVLAGGGSQREIAVQLGVSRGAVYRVCAGLKAEVT